MVEVNHEVTSESTRGPDQRGILRGVLHRNKAAAALSCLMLTVSMGLDTVSPWLMGTIIDQAISRRDPVRMLYLMLAFAVLTAVSFLAWRITYLTRLQVTAIENNLQRTQISGRLLDPRKDRIIHSAGEILTIASTDTRRVPQVLNLLFRNFPSVISLLIALVLLLHINTVLCLVAFGGAVITALVLRILAPTMIEHNLAQQVEVARTSSLASDLVKGIRVLQGIGAQDVAMERYQATSYASLRASVANARVSGWNQGASAIVAALILGILAAYSGHLAMRSSEGLSIGNFVTVLGICQMLIGPLSQLGDSTVVWAQATSSARRMSELLRYQLRGIHHHRQPFTGGDLCINARLVTVNECRFESPSGQVTAIMCDDPDAIFELTRAVTARQQLAPGSVRYGDFDLADGDPLALRQFILAEPAKTDLFEGTLREAVSFGRPLQVNDGEVLAALVWAAASDLLTSMSDGLDSRLLDRGSNLSGGQRQRVGLARALFAARTVLVLENPTTAVDSVTELAIADGIREARARAGFVTLIFTSSPALLEAADQVIHISQGRIAHRGKHHDLLRTSPDYAEAALR